MKNKVVISIACCALIAPLALAKDKNQKRTASAAAAEQGVTVTGTVVNTTVEEGAAASYQPPKTLIVRNDRSSDTSRYVLEGPGHVFNKNGEIIRTAIKPGTHVRVYYASANGVRTIDHVVVD